jgi:hypothetical protein
MKVDKISLKCSILMDPYFMPSISMVCEAVVMVEFTSRAADCNSCIGSRVPRN